MKIKSILIVMLTLLSLTAVAQSGGVTGKVVSRTTRQPLEGVKVTLTPGNIITESGNNGIFLIEPLESGVYELIFETPEFETLHLPVRVANMVRDINQVVLIPDVAVSSIDDAIFAEFDNETLEDAQSIPTSLSASKDLFNNIASYKFSEMRFNLRGYDSQAADIYMNGIQLNDAMTGYSPWSLWSGLNDVTRNQEVTGGLIMGNVGIGGIGGVTNINTRPSQIRKGFRTSLVSGNAMYRFRGMVTYASGVNDKGWSYAISGSTRQGGNEYVHGVFYNAFGYFAAIEKQFNENQHIGISILGAPTERGTQQASTQEVYDLVGNNYYNPNWGWQDGKRRNSRVRKFHEPIAMMNYSWQINDRSQLNAATSFRFGKNGYSALTWYAGPDPRPDYYRYLPSYYKGTSEGAWLQEAWLTNQDNIRHIDWDQLYSINRDQPATSTAYGTGKRAINMVEERHADQLDWNFASSYSHLFKNNSTLAGGLTFRRNRTSYYSEVADLLGGDYWIDVDKFAERDMGELDPISYQNDMNYYMAHGHARAAKVGDKVGYYYDGNIFTFNKWMSYTFNIQNLAINLGGEFGHTSMWRHGHWQKGLFLDNSYGNSKTQKYWTYRFKGNFMYRISAKQWVEANVSFMQDAPTFNNAFISPRTRNSATPGIKTSKTFSADATYNLRINDIRLRLTGYYTKMMDQSRVLSYYDDIEATFTNFAMSGIDKKFFGLEFAATVPIYMGLSFNTALSWGQYTYDSNPDYVQIQDNNGVVKGQGKVYWKNFRVETGPQTALNLGLSYRSRNNVYVSVDANYYNNNYISMSPVYRTDEVLNQYMSEQSMRDLRDQERFDGAWVMNASIGKSWYIKRTYTIGVNVDVKNIINDQNIKTGGYEQIRLLKNKDESHVTYQPFDSKYFYMFGTTYYLNLYFRF